MVVPLQSDFTAAELGGLAGMVNNVCQSCRLPTLAAVMNGMKRSEAARIDVMDRQTLRDWVHRFNAEGPEGLKDIRSGGSTCRLSVERQAGLASFVEAGPNLVRDRVVRWRGGDLKGVIV